MRETITISLPGSLRERLDKMVETAQVNRSDVVREALRQYLQREEFQRLRRAMIPQAQSQGIYTDEDVFEQIS
jgi:metal-responsive CopG/Arc/MetJ family transcriptional regulator